MKVGKLTPHCLVRAIFSSPVIGRVSLLYLEPSNFTPADPNKKNLIDIGLEGVIWATVTRKKNICPFGHEKT